MLKSFAQADRARHELNRLLLLVGACALCAGTVLMLAISGVITAPIGAAGANVASPRA